MRKINRNNVIQMRVGEVREGLLDLCRFLQNNNVKIMAEIGVYAGASTEEFAKVVDKIYAIDPFEGGYDPRDKASLSNMELVEKEFDEIVNKYKNITKIKKDSICASSFFKDKSLHFSYIDGCHTEEATFKDIECFLPKIEDGFFIGGHDFTSRKHPGVRRAILSFFEEKDIIVFKDTSWIVRV